MFLLGSNWYGCNSVMVVVAPVGSDMVKFSSD